ncbi:MAG: hypothetical protein RLY57_280 [Candidatus Parcubacteria bacterium]|jgi:formamidopyrimidine-DNA glycosylase
MPELPEVQTTVDGINQYVQGKTIADVWTDYASNKRVGADTIKDPKYFLIFKNALIGTTITHASRRAKNVLIHLSSGDTILVHMKMTGHLLYGTFEAIKEKQKIIGWKGVSPLALTDSFNRFIHLTLNFTDGTTLALCDMRKFAKVTLIKKGEQDTSEHISNIGPELLDKDFTYSLFVESLLKNKTGRIKTVLMKPHIIAGVGNIYSDEALWYADIHPETPVRDISDMSMKLLFKAVKEVLRKGIDFGGDSMSDYRNILGERGTFQGKHNAYRKTGSPCKKKGCTGVIQRKVVGGRSAHFCNVHQK